MTDYLNMYFDEKNIFQPIVGDENLNEDDLNTQILRTIEYDITEEKDKNFFKQLYQLVIHAYINDIPLKLTRLRRLYRMVKNYIPGTELVNLQMRKSAKKRTTRKSAKKRTTRKSVSKKRSARKSRLRCPTGCVRKSPRR